MNEEPLTFDLQKQYWGCNVDPYGEIHIFCGLVSAFLSATNLYYLEWYLVTGDSKTRMCDHTHRLFETKDECYLFTHHQEMKKIDDQIETLLQKRHELETKLIDTLPEIYERLSTKI